MPSSRNKCEIPRKTSKRKCHAPACCNLGGKNMCILHKMHIYTQPARVIQNAYTNYKMRRAINIYINLPKDLQGKISFHMRENSLIKIHHHDVIQRKITDKLERLIMFGGRPDTRADYLVECIHMFKLAIKYFEILDYDSHIRFGSTIVHGFTIHFKKNNQPVEFRETTVILKKLYLDYLRLIMNNPELKSSFIPYMYPWVGQRQSFDDIIQVVWGLY